MTPLAFEPLSDEELDELDHFMLHEVDCDEGMTLDMLDGYLHAIAIGPKTLMPRQWMPAIWGDGDSMMPPVESIEKLNQILGLIMRMFNSIIAGLEEDPPEIYPQWCTQEYRGREYDDAEGWAYGFTQGVHRAKRSGRRCCRHLRVRPGIARLACWEKTTLAQIRTH